MRGKFLEKLAVMIGLVLIDLLLIELHLHIWHLYRSRGLDTVGHRPGPDQSAEWKDHQIGGDPIPFLITEHE